MVLHIPRPVVANFYENSFKQLSSIQQKQVGLLLGVGVADAAARALEGYSASEISELEKGDGRTCSSDTDSAVVFASVDEDELGGHTALSDNGLRQLREQRGRNPLLDHSFTYMLYFALLRTMSSSRGDFPVSYVEPLWVEASHRVHPELVFAQEHGSLLHTLCTLLPIPTIYPYASDETLRTYVDPFIECLTTPPPSLASQPEHRPYAEVEETFSSTATPQTSLVELEQTERTAVRNFTKSALGVPLRCLQSIADPERNAAFVSLPGTADIFTSATRHFCPPPENKENGGDANNPKRWYDLQKKHLNCYVCKASRKSMLSLVKKTDIGPVPFLPLRPVLYDTQIVQEAFAVCRSATSFAAGVGRAVRLGGPVCQRAMIVGALLGAKYGARSIPLPWVSATVDHKPLATMAIEIAQWSWNPPHH